MLIDALESLWDTILDVTSLFVMPDWNGIIALLPVVTFVGAVAPLVTLFVLVALVYQARKPRVKVTYEEGPRMAELDDGGQPVFPSGLPHCRRDALVYPSGTTRCTECRDDLSVVCPMCGVGRNAELDTCGNCGLVLRIENRAITVRRGRPKPGGAAAA